MSDRSTQGSAGAEDPSECRPFRPRHDPPLTARFAKDASDERFLEELNATVAPAERAAYRDVPERLPTLHIIGAPRSGTTLLGQVLVSALDVGYIDNLTASFWRAPVTGLRLARKLGIGPDGDFGSQFGRTDAIGQPHEFGYFWNHHLRYPDLVERSPEHEDTIDWAELRRVLINLAEARGASMVFKPMLLIWHLERMAREMPRSCFVWIRRPARETALSILRMREALRGSVDQWASLRPDGIPDSDPPWRQVVAQVVALERTIERAAVRLGPDTLLPITYADLCADPNRTVAAVRELMAGKGGAPQLRRDDLPVFTPGPSRGLEDRFGDLVDAELATLSAARKADG